MSRQSLQVLHELVNSLREEDERRKQVEKERDVWKAKYDEIVRDRDALNVKYEKQKIKLKELESFQNAVEVQSNDIIESLSHAEKLSGQARTEPSNVSSAESIPRYRRTRELELSVKTLKHKYRNLSELYNEAKRQNKILKELLDQKYEKWREWREWWNTQKQNLRTKSISLVENANGQDIQRDVQSQVRPSTSGALDISESVSAGSDDEAMDELFKTTFSPDAVAARRDTQSLMSPKVTHAACPVDTLNVQKTIEISEITEVPESPLVSLSKGNPIVSPKAQLSPRPKSAPVRRIHRSPSPLSTRSSGRLRKREYPNLKYWTEDGTDGINPLSPSPPEPSDGGLLSSLLAGPPDIPSPKPSVSPLALEASMQDKSVVKKGRLRENADIYSDKTQAERDPKRQRVHQESSESRPHRPMLSPDLASKNKGRGRYAESVITRTPADRPRLEDFQIDRKNNQGVSHPFTEVVRGKEARKSLPGTFYEAHGPCTNTTGSRSCGHAGRDEHVQQVSRHRQLWEKTEKPHGFWDSHFPSASDLTKAREESEKQKAERVRKVAEEVARGNGRWKRREF